MLACDAGAKPASQATAAASATGVAPAPSATPDWAGTQTAGPVGSLPLPTGSDGNWHLVEILAGGDTLLLQYVPEATSQEARNQLSNRMAFYDVATGALRDFRQLNPGEQIGSHGSDDEFVVWTEIPIVDMSHRGWRMYAWDMSSQDVWEVAADSGVWLGSDRPHDPDVALDKGRVAYVALSRNATGLPRYDLRLADLHQRTTETLIVSEETAQHWLTTPALSGQTLVWIDEWPGMSEQRPTILRMMDVSTRESRALVSGDNVRQYPRVDRGWVVVSVDGNMQVINAATAEVESSWSATPAAASISVSFSDKVVAWAEEESGMAMAFRIASGRVVELGGPLVGETQIKNGRLYWVRSTLHNTARATAYLEWVELLPQG